MVIKEVTLDKSGKQKFIEGINLYGDVVSTTLGARGKTVIIEDEGGMPYIVADGFEVGEAIVVSDPLQNLGCELMKEGAVKVVNEAGDQTTTFAVLAQNLVNLSIAELEKGEKSENQIKKELLQSKELVIAHLKKLSKPLTAKLLKDVAKTSCRGDVELSNHVSEAFKKAGRFGVVTHTRSETENTYVDFIDGTLIESGYNYHEIFCNKFAEQKAEWENPIIVLSEIKFMDFTQAKPFVDVAALRGRSPIIFIADMDMHLKNAFVNNFRAYLEDNKKGYPCLVIDPPNAGTRRKDYLLDLGLLINAEVITTTAGIDFSATADNYMGTCERFTSVKNDSILVTSKDLDLSKINAKIEEFAKIIKNSNNDEEKRFFEDRIAKLNGKIAIVKVGAGIESELKEKISRVEDAVKAVKAARIDGVLAGGGVALYDACDKLELDFITSVSIVGPLNKILENAGFKDEMNIGQYPSGFDVIEEKEVDMFEAGIIDTTRGVVSAYSHAVSVATTVLGTSCMITRKRKP